MAALNSDWQMSSIPQLADHLGVAKTKIRRWIETGELSAANTATTTRSRPIYRIRRSDFETFWRARATVQTSAAPERRRRPRATKEYV